MMLRLTCFFLLAATTVQAQQSGSAADEIRVFKLRNVISSEAGPTLSQLFEDAVITGDDRTNSLLVRCSAEDLEEIRKVLEVLDQSPRYPSKNYAPAVGQYAKAVAAVRQQNPRQSEYLQLEQEIETLAASCRKLEDDASEESVKQRLELVDQLNNLVARAFDIRQKMRREDVKLLRQRLTQVEATVNQREAAKDEIIEHRIASLLDADRNPATPDARAPIAQYLSQTPAGPATTKVRPGLSPTPRYDFWPYLPDATRTTEPPAPNAKTGLPAMQSRGERLASLRAHATNLESLHAAAERCLEVAEAADHTQWEKCLAAYRAVERRFRTYRELTALELQAAEAKLQASETRLARVKSLFEGGVTPTREYNEAQSELKLRQIDVRRARVAVEFFEQLLTEANEIVDQAITKIEEIPM